MLIPQGKSHLVVAKAEKGNEPQGEEQALGVGASKVGLKRPAQGRPHPSHCAEGRRVEDDRRERGIGHADQNEVSEDRKVLAQGAPYVCNQAKGPNVEGQT